MQEIAVIGPGGAVETTLEGLEEAARRLSGGKYRMAPEVEEIARRLIAEHHKHLATARIAYVMAESLPAQKGKAPMARAQKASEAQNLLHGYDFVITVNRQVWVLLTPEQREALVDHELCLPAGVVVTGPQVKAAVSRRYTGKIVEITTASGYFLPGTPNHPVLTDRGWVPLGLLKKGDHVVSCRFPERVAAAMDPDEYQVEALIEDIACSGRVPLGLVPQTAHDFYAHVTDHEVNVVSPNGGLVAHLITPGAEHGRQIQFGRRHSIPVPFSRLGELTHSLFGMTVSPPYFMGFFESGQGALPLVRPLKPHFLGSTYAADGNLALLQDAVDYATVNAHFLRERIGRCSPGVGLDEVIRVDVAPFDSHVYNLQTAQSWYIANHIVTHNCHCGLKEDGSWTIWAHDVEEFAAVIKRHGLWHDGARVFAKAVEQLEFDLGGAAQ